MWTHLEGCFSTLASFEYQVKHGLSSLDLSTMRLSSVVGTVVGLLSSLTIAESNLTIRTQTEQKLLLKSDFKPAPVFENTNVVRTINLEKGYVRETVNVVVTNTDKAPQSDYYVPFDYDLMGKISGFDARDKAKAEQGPLDSTIAALSGVLGVDGKHS